MAKFLKKFLAVLVLIISSLSFQYCGLINFDFIYKEPFGYMYVVLITSLKTQGLEKTLSCYYSTYNEFPKHVSDLNNFIDTLNIDNDDNLIFSKLERDYSKYDVLKYRFELAPYATSFNSDSSNFFIDSIRVYKLCGNLIFSDSLIQQNLDSLIVEMEIVSMIATTYEEDDSIYYDDKSSQIFYDGLRKPFAHKISVKNRCIK